SDERRTTNVGHSVLRPWSFVNPQNSSDEVLAQRQSIPLRTPAKRTIHHECKNEQNNAERNGAVEVAFTGLQGDCGGEHPLDTHRMMSARSPEVREYINNPDTGYKLLAEHALQVVGDQKFRDTLYLDELDTRYTDLVG